MLKLKRLPDQLLKKFRSSKVIIKSEPKSDDKNARKIKSDHFIKRAKYLNFEETSLVSVKRKWPS